MDNRFKQLLLYLEKQKISTKDLVAIKSDASFRKYYRLENNILVMDAASEKGESVSKFSERKTFDREKNQGDQADAKKPVDDEFGRNFERPIFLGNRDNLIFEKFGSGCSWLGWDRHQASDGYF